MCTSPSFEEVQKDFIEELEENGSAKCPCCLQRAGIYDRSITKSVALDLLKMYQRYGRNWVEFRKVDSGSREHAKTRYWGIVEAENPESTRTRWRLTEDGVDWLRGDTLIPKYAQVYDSHLQRLHGDWYSVLDAVGEDFDLDSIFAKGPVKSPIKV